ncbi:MAG: monofunctional biosynthetic peptidoglycan transglycosylase, partial [Gammaproteobacteria bacterium]|nr:monofunctional biosynthetic peptidoglycan transglycosylase [Gammaproteobacteria bacterium]
MLVLLLRWVPPPTSAFMLAARVSAMAGGDFAYSNAYD